MHPNRTHGEAYGATKTREYRVWQHAKFRCTNRSDSAYKNYGGRGITMSQAWLNDYPAFLRDMGRCPPGCQLDRIDNDGPYAKQNCRWATKSVQMSNTRRNRWIEFSGERHIMSEWSRRTGIVPEMLIHRLDKLGWTIERALTTPTFSPQGNSSDHY